MGQDFKKIATADGSFTLRLDAMDETYHSVNGAYTESNHVFIQHGFNRCKWEEVSVLEIGFGTGLNALLTLNAFLKQKKVEKVSFCSLEKFPVDRELALELNYGKSLSEEMVTAYSNMHSSSWDVDIEIMSDFNLKKLNLDLLLENLTGSYNLVYFDAFAPSKQPEMWQKHILKKVVDVMMPGGIFTTYCAKGEVRRNLAELGLEMSRVPGPPGKREMLVGVKL